MDLARSRTPVAVTAAVVVLLVAMTLGISVGAVPLAPSAIWSSILHRLGLAIGTPLTGLDAQVLFAIRLPRVVLGALVGGMLALAGASYQGVFRNPLADPYLLGAAAGAGLGATVVIAYAPVAALPIAAFVGSLTGVALAYAVGSVAARQGGGGASLLLAGVAVASFLTALQTLVQQANTDVLRQVYSWILGQLGTSGWGDVALVLPYMAVSTVVLLASARALDVLAVGDDEASTLGVQPRRIRFIVLLAASLGTASAVCVSGLIGFVGLVIPHIVRRLTRSTSYRVILPGSLIMGGAFLVLADVVARTVVAPAELPIGVVTAFVGAPFFAALLRIGGHSS